MKPLEPMRFERHFVEKVWGGRSLERVPGIELPADVRIGETWEVVDREAENSVVATGAHRGRTLRELMREHGAAILGRARPGKEGRFPLLVKYLDASQDLSVQVHPDEAAAAKRGGAAEAKTEAWYIVDAAPAGVLYAGLRDGVEREEFARVAADAGVVELLARWPARRGDCLLVGGGTVHAIGAGVTILEVQQNSDTTYRLYDWGRVGLDGKPRETHVEEALACVRFGAPAEGPAAAPTPGQAGDIGRSRLVESHVFAMDLLRVRAPSRCSTDGAFRLYAVLGGSGTLTVEGGERAWRLNRGDVWLVPAACEYHSLAPDAGELELVDMTPGS